MEYQIELGGQPRKMLFSLGVLKYIREKTEKDPFNIMEIANDVLRTFDFIKLIMFGALSNYARKYKTGELFSDEQLDDWACDLSAEQKDELIRHFNNTLVVSQEEKKIPGEIPAHK